MSRRFFYFDEEDEQAEITIEYLKNKIPTLQDDDNKDKRIKEYFTISLMENKLDVCEYLISIQGAEFFHGYPYSRDILARLCSIETAEFAVRHKFSLSYVNMEGENIFLRSFYSSNVNINFLRYLVENGVDFNRINLKRDNAIILLAKLRISQSSDHIKIFQYLIELGVDYHHENGRKFNVLLEYFCSQPKNLSLEIIKYLISLGITFKYDDKNDSRRGLIFLYALKGGNLDIIKFLVENGVEFDYFDPKDDNIIKRNKPLSYLIEHMNCDLFKYIIDNEIDNENYTPYGKKFYILHYLVFRLRAPENQNLQKLNDFFQCFLYFKSRGNDVNEIDSLYDKTPLLSLGEQIKYRGDFLLLVINFLIKEGCDLMYYNDDGSILHHLFLRGKYFFSNEISLKIANLIIFKTWDYWKLENIQNKLQWKNNFYQCINNIAPILNLTDRDGNPSPFLPELSKHNK